MNGFQEPLIKAIKDIYPLGLCGCTEEELLSKYYEFQIDEAWCSGLSLSERARNKVKRISKFKAEMKKSKGKKPLKKC